MKPKFVLLAHYHSDLEPDGSVETDAVSPPYLLDITPDIDQVIEAIANIFDAHQSRMDRGIVDERISYVTVCSQVSRSGVQVCFYDFSGPPEKLKTKIRRYLRPFIRLHGLDTQKPRKTTTVQKSD